MLISISKFKMAAVQCTKEFMDFAHFYGISKQAETRYMGAVSKKPSFNLAEMNDAVKETKKAYEKAVNIAINKLFILDRKFSKLYPDEHIVARLENFEDYEKVLEIITNDIYTQKPAT